MKARLLAIRKQYWEARPQSERRIMLAAGTIVLPALAYLLLWQPAHREVGKLHQALPEQRIQAEHMQRWSREIEELRHRPKIATLDSIALKASIEESAVRHQLRETIDVLDAREPNGVHLSLGSVSFARWLEWLRSLQQEQHVRVESLAVTPLNEPGMASIRATLVSGADQ